jgi:hypothetical protein
VVRCSGFSKLFLAFASGQGSEMLCQLERKGARDAFSLLTVPVTSHLPSLVCQASQTHRMADVSGDSGFKACLLSYQEMCKGNAFEIKIEMNHSFNCFPFIIIVE